MIACRLLAEYGGMSGHPSCQMRVECQHVYHMVASCQSNLTGGQRTTEQEQCVSVLLTCIVAPALFRIFQNTVGSGNLLEFLGCNLSRLALVFVRVVS